MPSKQHEFRFRMPDGGWSCWIAIGAPEARRRETEDGCEVRLRPKTRDWGPGKPLVLRIVPDPKPRGRTDAIDCIEGFGLLVKRVLDFYRNGFVLSHEQIIPHSHHIAEADMHFRKGLESLKRAIQEGK